MAKKTAKEVKGEKITFKTILNQFMENSVQSLISVAAQEAEHLIIWIKSLSNLGRKIRKLLTTIILFSAGLGVLGIGIALYINELYPKISPGISHILIGSAIILIAALYSKFSE